MRTEEEKQHVCRQFLEKRGFTVTSPEEDVPSSLEDLAGLARLFDCITADEFRVLCGCTESTEEAWRKRGSGPSYILLGKRYLYPIEAVKHWMQGRLRERSTTEPIEL